jgi:hypothetical protein
VFAAQQVQRLKLRRAAVRQAGALQLGAVGDEIVRVMLPMGPNGL